MITVEIKGGLGNQMFQYAMAQSLALYYNDEITFDLSWFETQEKRQFLLDKFNIHTKIAKINIFNFILLKVFSFFNIKKIGRLNYLYEKKQYVFDASVFDLSGNFYIEGYWQNEKYFTGIRDILIKKFLLKEEMGNKAKLIKSKIKQNQSVSLHVRRGDYATDSRTKAYHGLCSIDYFKKSILEIRKRIDNPTFFIFSDDIEWVKSSLNIDSSVTYVRQEGVSDIEELMLMSLCNHNIISNSSFSWWAAWLNTNKTKIVFAPDKWLNDSREDASDIIPSSWKKIT